MYVERIVAYRVLVWKPEEKRDHLDLQEVGWWWGGMDWIDLAEDRDRWRALVEVVMNLQVP
jgi:hypothetical protein